MLDLSFITGAAPAAGPVGRAPQGAGPAGAVDATSFVDALATLAAFTSPSSDDAVAGDAGVSTSIDEWLDTATDGSDTLPTLEPVIDATPAAGALMSAAVPPAPELPSHDVTAAPADDDAGVREQTSPATTPYATAVAVAPTPGVPGEPATTTAGSTATPRTNTVDAPASQAPSTPASSPDTSASQPGTSSAASAPVPDTTEDVATENGDVVFKRSADRGDRLDARAAGERRSHAAAMTSSPAGDVSPAAAAEAVARANRATDVPVRTVSVETPSSMPASAPVSSSAPVAAESLSPAIGSSTSQRPSSDAGDTSAGFAFAGHGHAGPRLAAPAPVVSASTFASLVNASATPDALPAETTTQIVQSIRLQMLRDGGEAHIRLDPRQFGDMTVRVKVEQGQVIARVEADTPVVREWLQSNQHVLRQSLASQQLTLDRLEVHEPPPSDRGRRDDESGRGGQQDQPRHPRRQRPETGELFEVVA